jgi:hypothetical protein
VILCVAVDLREIVKLARRSEYSLPVPIDVFTPFAAPGDHGKSRLCCSFPHSPDDGNPGESEIRTVAISGAVQTDSMRPGVALRVNWGTRRVEIRM